MRRKYIIKRFELLILALLPMAVGAEEVKINGLWYEIDTSGGTAEVTRSGGSGDLIIPSSVTYAEQSYSVTSIGYWAFGDCPNLTSVTIPNSVTSIGEQAFSNCTGLTSVTIPNSVTSIGNSAFYNCEGLTSVTIPNSVISIGRGAFWGCTNLSTITIPNSVTSIGFDTFGSCSSLASITVESGNSTYDSRDNCNAIIETASNTLIIGIKTTRIPDSVTSIGVYAFYCCTGLTSIDIPNSVTSIGSSAFSYCSGLTSVTVDKDTPISISSNTFSNRANATLYVPYGSKAAYESAPYWSEFKEIIEIDNSQEQLVKGDLNGDGTVSISDVVLIIDVMAGTITDADQVAAADVNGDGEVSITDCVAAIDLIASSFTSTTDSE